MYYTNENTDLYETSNITPEGANTNNETISVVRAKANSNAQEIKGMVKADVNFVVPTGVMVSAGIDNYKEGAQEYYQLQMSLQMQKQHHLLTKEQQQLKEH